VKDTVSKQADTVKQSAAAAVEDVKSQVSMYIRTAVFSPSPSRQDGLRGCLGWLEKMYAPSANMRLQVLRVLLSQPQLAYLPAGCLTLQTLKLANSAVSNIDSLVADVSSNVAAVKRDAGSSSKAAGLAIDSMVTRAIEKGQAVKETLAGGPLVQLNWQQVHRWLPGCAADEKKQLRLLSMLRGTGQTYPTVVVALYADGVCAVWCAVCSWEA
jgi:hypothetical protein